jgi:hypothetical protein
VRGLLKVAGSVVEGVGGMVGIMTNVVVGIGVGVESGVEVGVSVVNAVGVPVESAVRIYVVVMISALVGIAGRTERIVHGILTGDMAARGVVGVIVWSGVKLRVVMSRLQKVRLACLLLSRETPRTLVLGSLRSIPSWRIVGRIQVRGSWRIVRRICG